MTPLRVGLFLLALWAASSSAVLVRWAEAAAVALAFWRCLGGAAFLAPVALRNRRLGRDQTTRAEWKLILVAGIALGIHFSTWLASLELTSVAASVTLVSTAPVFVAFMVLGTGGAVQRQTWLAIGLTVLGVGIIAAGDALGSSDGIAESPLLGDGLALVGAVAIAVYFFVGQRARENLSAAGYAARTYGVAAVVLVPTAMLTGTALTGFSGETWLAIVGMIVGPQLIGHTTLNFLLNRIGSLSVSLGLLAEPIAATILVWMVFREAPPATAWVGTPVVLGGLIWHLRTMHESLNGHSIVGTSGFVRHHGQP